MAVLADSEKKGKSPRDEALPIPPEYKNKKLIVKIWSDTGENGTPQVLFKRTVKYGTPFVTAKIAGKDRLFKINYRTKGVIKQDGKKLYTDIHFLNAVGSLAFYEFKEDMDSEEAYTIFKNNAVNMYVKKGGISPMTLYICIGAICAMGIGYAIVSPYIIQSIQQHEVDIKDLTSASAKIQALRDQVVKLGEIPRG